MVSESTDCIDGEGLKALNGPHEEPELKDPSREYGYGGCRSASLP